MTNEIRDMVVDKLRDIKFKGIKLPSVAEGNLPAKYCDFPHVNIPRNNYNMFRDMYLLMQVSLTAILGKADFTQYELEELLFELASGMKSIEIKGIRGIE